MKQQIHRAEKATQELEEQRTRAARAEYSLATLQAQWQEYEARRGIGGWIEEEEELEETHWDKGTQTEDVMMEQCLPPKKCPIQTEEVKCPLVREDLKVIHYQSQEADNTFITSDGTSPYNSARKWAVKRHYREDNN